MAENSPKQSHMLTKVEQRGLEPVPDDQRNGTPGQLFWVWFAANISILGIPLGATLISLGLNVWQSVLVTAIGSFGSFALVGHYFCCWSPRRSAIARFIARHFRCARKHWSGSCCLV